MDLDTNCGMSGNWPASGDCTSPSVLPYRSHTSQIQPQIPGRLLQHIQDGWRRWCFREICREVAAGKEVVTTCEWDLRVLQQTVVDKALNMHRVTMTGYSTAALEMQPGWAETTALLMPHLVTTV
jgi:hypothetical protein